MWHTYLIPRQVRRFSSCHNRDIRVIEECGKYKILVGGTIQSGEYIKKLWQRALGFFSLDQRVGINEILVLGVAGGSVVTLLRKLYKSARIQGVDLDSQMIELGKQYFSLGDTNVELTVGDAQKYVQKAARQKQRFDLVLVDIFIGRTIPEFVVSDSFLKNLRSLLGERGFAVINYLTELEAALPKPCIMKRLQKVFTLVKDMRYEYSHFYCAYI